MQPLTFQFSPTEKAVHGSLERYVSSAFIQHEGISRRQFSLHLEYSALLLPAHKCFPSNASNFLPRDKNFLLFPPFLLQPTFDQLFASSYSYSSSSDGGNGGGGREEAQPKSLLHQKLMEKNSRCSMLHFPHFSNDIYGFFV